MVPPSNSGLRLNVDGVGLEAGTQRRATSFQLAGRATSAAESGARPLGLRS
jgi:hypothetical protein